MIKYVTIKPSRANENAPIFPVCFCVGVALHLFQSHMKEGKCAATPTQLLREHSVCYCCRLLLGPAFELLLIWSILVLHWGTKQGPQSSATITQQDKDRLLAGDLCRKHSDTKNTKLFNPTDVFNTCKNIWWFWVKFKFLKTFSKFFFIFMKIKFSIYLVIWILQLTDGLFFFLRIFSIKWKLFNINN